MAVTYPHVKVTVPEGGLAVLSRVELDGKQIPATRVKFDTGETINGYVKLVIETLATIELDSDAPMAVAAVQEA